MDTYSGCYLGVDVGTGSARAAFFTVNGRMLANAASDLQLWRPQADFAEQSSEAIWQAACASVRNAMRDAGLRPQQVRGIGFDATCSLVALDAAGQPVTVSPTGRAEQNVIVWMDHRAVEQAERINAIGHDVLRYVGGRISPEMETPKLLWLKARRPTSWQRATQFFDLPDYLTFRATGRDTRSLCSTACKWTYLAHAPPTIPGSVGAWDASYWHAIGLREIADEGWSRVGRIVRPMGEPVGNGLSARAAAELGLAERTPVGVSIIDAHAGGLGMLGARLDGDAPTPETMERRLALIGGTSSCHMAVSRQALFVPGVWGPYFSAMVPGLWLTEGGQSATGALIDHIIHSHARSPELTQEARTTGRSVYELLNARLDALAARERVEFPAALTRELHVLPYFHGNRSPRADASLRGTISGLRLSDSIDDLALLYLATIQAIAHGTRHIIETMNAHGYAIETIFACGGGTKNPIFVREHADITGCRLILPLEPEAVLLGAAILGAVAAGDFDSVLSAMAAMNAAGQAISPSGGDTARYHAAKYAVFGRMYDDQMAYRSLMTL